MLSPVTKEISGYSVHFRPLPATKAFVLAKRVGSLLLPMLKSIDLSDLKKDIDFSKIFDTLSEALATLSDEDAISIVVESLRGSTITAPGLAPMEIQSNAEVDSIFAGDLEAMYQIVFESWKYNKLAPFKLAARFGLQMKTTDTSSEAADTETKFGPKLALSGASMMK
jgi:hypothetical protein